MGQNWAPTPAKHEQTTEEEQSPADQGTTGEAALSRTEEERQVGLRIATNHPLE